ncbi:MAG TPA: MlaD family protein [Candidatus Eisenbacteria bacterium]|jgi:phospholipid/cholesterol/gamma-HCH transport system substrate-binding protein|nr:MlaD family protein [Candidatus Eisenbacteria bacterium]
MIKKSNLEFRVGLFVLLSLAILGWLVIKAGDFNLKPGYLVRFTFNSVAGIEVGSPIRLAGVPVGEVKTIQVIRSPQGETQVEITGWVAQGAFIESDAEIRINSLGLLGEKYLEITPGTSGAKTLSDGGILPGKTPVSMEKISEAGNRLIQKLEFAVDNINHVVADPGFQNSVKGTFGKAEGTFGKAEGAMDSAQAMIADLKGMSTDLKEAANSAKIVLGRLRDGEGTVGRLLKDDKMARDLEAFAADIKAHPWRLLKRD